MATIDLRFAPDARQPLELVFGDTGDDSAPQYTLRGAGPVTGLRGGARLHVAAGLHPAGQLAQLPRIGTLAYNSNVDRPLLGWQRPRAQPAAPLAAPRHSGWQHSRPLTVALRPAAQQAAPLVGAARLHWQRSAALQQAWRAQAQLALALQASARGAFQRSITLATTARQRLQQGQPLAAAARARFEEVIRLRASTRALLQQARPLAALVHDRMRQAAPLAVRRHLHFQLARPPLPGISPRPPAPDARADWCYTPALPIELLFQPDPRPPLDLLFICERHAGPDQPPATVIVLRRRSYIVLTSLEVTRVDTGQVVPVVAGSFSMELDMQSFTWSFGFGTPGLARQLLMPGADGLPPELEVKVNGVPYRMHAESVERTVQHPRAMLAVSGRGLAAMLDAPYAATRSFAQPAPITAQQLMLDVLTINGVSIGWSLDWQLDDWHIPANSWAHHGSWIEAINDIAAAVGASVQPHDTDQVLRILPRYPVASWLLAGATPDVELPPGIASVERTEWPVKPAYDAIYMHGEPGVAVYHRTVPGSAGTVLAPMAVHPLLVHADAARQRAIAELSDRGRQVLHELTLPLLPDTGLIKPGLLLRYTDDDDVTRTGIVRATRVADSAVARITQTIRIQAHEP